MNAIVAQGVSRSFGAVQAVRDASFRAESGRVTGLIGPNGSGKTTLLLMLASLLAPDTGSIRLGDVDPIADPRAARMMLGWMPDMLGAWPSLTSHETLVTTGRLYDIPRAEAARRADELLELVGLGELATAPAKVLSRGQKQKLGLARALVHDPKALLLDEPASGLDPAARVQLRQLLRGFADEGRTVIISSHVLSELEEVVDDAVFMVAGTVVDAQPQRQRARTWRLRFAGAGAEHIDQARQHVAEALGVPADGIGADRGALLLSFPGEAEAATALGRVVGAGLAVAEFAPAQSRLEQTFMSLGEAEPPQVAASDSSAASDTSDRAGEAGA